MKTEYYIFACFVVLGLCNICSADPCHENQHAELPDMERRYDSYSADIDAGETFICDKYHIPAKGQWYKTDLNMPTSPPQLLMCGTVYPIWYQGTLPTTLNEHVNGTGCMVSDAAVCLVSYPIEIKKCNGFFVYRLFPTKVCSEAYCFGNGVMDMKPEKRPPKPVIKYSLQSIESTRRETLQFECFIGESSQLEYPVYQVTWVVDGDSRFTYVQNKSNLANLQLSELTLKQLNKNLKCIARARNRLDGRPGPSSTSEEFYAGIKIDPSVITLKRDEQQTVKLNLSVPFGRIRIGGNIFLPEKLTIEMSVPAIDGNKCNGELSIQAAQNCYFEINHDKWNDSFLFNITYKDTEKYKLNLQNPQTYVLKLQVASGHFIWYGMVLNDIHVNIIDDTSIPFSLDKKICRSHNDPHMTTFDGRKYELQETGTYMLYDFIDSNRPMQVQIKLESCNPPYQVNFCNCGVAVRAGGDLFVVDICNNKRTMEYRTCFDKILDVRRLKGNDQLYSIFFPTGTRVDISFSIGKFNVEIRSSVHDVFKTRGLCGNLSGTCVDDFRLKDGNLSKAFTAQHECTNQMYTGLRPKDFIDSWRLDIKQEQTLFEIESNSTEIGRWNETKNYCTCPKNTSDVVDYLFQCSPDSTVQCVRDNFFAIVNTNVCHVKPGRKKRSIEYPWKSFARRKRSAQNFPVHYTNMTAEEARQYCDLTYKATAIFQKCSEITNLPSESALEACALDIQLTNSLNWVSNTMETFKSGCLAEAQLNPELDERTSNNTPSLAETISEILCPGLPECSSNGQCVHGVCQCKEGFIASDCSIRMSEPPHIFGLRGDGLCDIREIPCDTAFVVGEEIRSSKNLSCRVQKFLMTFEGGKTLLHSEIVNGNLQTLMEVHCPLSISQERIIKTETNYFVEGYIVSISYDQIHFGDKFEVVIHDSLCQDYDVVSNKVSLKNGTCFIDRVCYVDGAQHSSNVCLYCNHIAPYIWSVSDNSVDCVGAKVKPESIDTAVIVGSVVGSLVCFLMIAGGFMFYNLKTGVAVKEMTNIVTPVQK